MSDKVQPLVSIVVPIYNVSSYLKKCVNSLLVQTYPNIEIILVDDCSTDNSADIAKELEVSNNEKICFVQRQSNGGLSAARNSGIKVAKGEWITFIDSDDWVAPIYIEKLLDSATNFDADVVMGGVNYAFDNGKIANAYPFGNLNNEASKKQIIAMSRSYACGRLYKKSLFSDNCILFPEDIKRSEDIATIIPILTYARSISLVKQPLYSYYQRSNSISNSNKNIDLTFYKKTVRRMFALSKTGYEEELKFRAIHEMLYGMVLLMIKAKKPEREFRQHINWFEKEYPDWQENKYLKNLPKRKYIFIKLASKKQYFILKCLVAMNEMRK